MEEEKIELLSSIIGQPFVQNGIQDRYKRYKTEKHFYVPVSLYCLENGTVKVDIGDKSYTNLEELEKAILAWSENKIADLQPFVDLAWTNRNNNISVLVFIETEEYCFGSFFVIDPK